MIEIEKLQKYLRQELSKEETELLEKALSESPDDQQVLEGLRAMMEDEGLEGMDDMLESAEAQVFEQVTATDTGKTEVDEKPNFPPKENKSADRQIPWFRMAAALVLLAVSGYLIFGLLNKDGNDALVTEYLSEKDPLGLGSRGGQSAPDWAMAFERGNYKQVSELLEASNNLSDSENLFLALAYANTLRLEEAAEILSGFERASPLRAQSRFYLVLCQLKLGALDEAKSLAGEIIDNQSHGYEQLQKLSF